MTKNKQQKLPIVGGGGIKYDDSKTRYDLVDVSVLADLWRSPSEDEDNLSRSLFFARRHDFSAAARVLLISARDEDTVQDLSAVMAFGARKYGLNNWKKVRPTGRYLAAFERHMLKAINDIQSLDEETGYTHLAHAKCNLYFLLWFQREGVGITQEDC